MSDQAQTQNASSQQGDGSGAGASASAAFSIPNQQAQPETAGVGSGEPLPAAVAPPEEQLGAQSMADCEDVSYKSGRPLIAEPAEFDPTNPREFDPTVVLLHLERDGVVVEGFIDPFTGAGCHDLLVKLQDDLVKARSREDGAAPAHVQVGETPDPNALKRQRATSAGHDIDPETKRCRNCHNAEWWCLEGNPCEPREDAAEPAPIEEPANGEADSPSP